MYLKKTPTKSGRVSLSIVKGFRENGRMRQRTVETLGFLDELEERYPDPVAHFTEVARAMTEEERARTAPVAIEAHLSQKIDMRAAGRKNAGCAVPLSLYNALGVEAALRNATARSRLGFDVNAVCRLLVMGRIFSPASKLATWEGRGGYFFRSEFTDDDVYRALDVLADCSDRVVAAMNRSASRTGMRAGLGRAYYDVTNYYFEIDSPDALRRKGVSKEHRPDPVVQMGLLQDGRGLPLAFDLFPGNTPDCLTMIPVLEKLKAAEGVGRVVVVADKGLNASDNIAANVAAGNGFVFSQSVRGTKSGRGLREWVLSDEGYRERGDGFRIKSRIDEKTVAVKAGDAADGKAHKVPVEVKVVAFWSRKYAERARHERAETVRRARELVADPGAYSAATHYGAAKYVRGLDVDAGTGEVVDAARVLLFDEARLAEDEAADGFYCIVTSEVGMPDDEVVDAYRQLWRIEESFRITKSCLEARPVYVRTEKHVRAHFLVCYIALSILRMMQIGTGGRWPVQEMVDELARVSASPAGDSLWLFDHRSRVTQDLFDSVGLEHPTKWMRLADVKRLVSPKHHAEARKKLEGRNTQQKKFS